MADVEREVILQMASETMSTRKSSPNLVPSSSWKLSSPATTASMSDKSTEQKIAKTTSHPGSKTVEQTVPENDEIADVFEMRFKTDQCNSTDSPVRTTQTKSSSPPSSEKSRKGNRLEQNTFSQSKPWFEFLPFTQKKSPPKTAVTDHLGKSKNSSPAVSQNKSTDKNLSQQDRLKSTPKLESDESSNINQQKSSGLNSSNGQNGSSKPTDRQKCTPGPLYFFDVQQSSVRAKNYMKAEPKSTTLEELTKQQHKTFQEQMKKYAKSKQKGKIPEQAKTESQINEKVKDKEVKSKTHKHKDKNRNSKGSSELHQCLNCQMKAKRYSLQEQGIADSPNTSSQVSSGKKPKNQHLNSTDETTNHSNSITNVHRRERSLLPNGNCAPTNEGMYVTFNHCHKPTEHQGILESSRNHQMVASYPQYPNKKEEMKSNSKGNNLLQDFKMAPSASSGSKHLERSVQNANKPPCSVHPRLSIADSKWMQKRDESSLSQFSKSSTNNLSFSHANCRNGLTVTATPLCYNGVNIPCKNGAKTQGCCVIDESQENGSGIQDSVKRQNGGEYNNLSMDLHVNSQHMDAVQKSYIKRVPWHCGNIILESPKPDEELRKHSSEHLPYPSHKDNENKDMQRDNKSTFDNISDMLNDSVSETYNALQSLSANTNVLQAETNKEEPFNLEIKAKDDILEDQTDVTMKRLSPVEGTENWQELLTNSHDYFDSKYRLCYDADDQDVKNSTPSSLILENQRMEGTSCNTPLSHTRNTDNSAYVAFMSYPSTSSTSHVKEGDSLYKNFPSYVGNAKLPNGTIQHLAVVKPSITFPSSSSPPNKLNDSTRLSHLRSDDSNPCLLKKPVGMTISPIEKESHTLFPKYSKPIEPLKCSYDTDINKKLSFQNKTSASLSTNHVISSITVANGYKAAVSPTTANQIYLPNSLANGNIASVSPFTSHVGTSLSETNGNKESSVTKHIDYSKPMANGFTVNSTPTASSSLLKDFSTTSSVTKDTASFILSHNTNFNGNVIPSKENLNRPTSLFEKNPDNASSAPTKSLLKLFPNKLSTSGAHLDNKKITSNTEKCLAPNGTFASSPDSAVFCDKRKEDSRISSTTPSTLTPNHDTLPSNHSTLVNHGKHFGLKNHGLFCSPSSEMQKKNQDHQNLRHKTENKMKSCVKNNHRQVAVVETNTSKDHVFSVLPFGEYTVDNSVQHFPKSFSQLISENRKQGSNLHCDNDTTVVNDHKTSAIQKRDAKISTHPNDPSRYSSCSTHSTNEIQILKWMEGRDPICQSKIKEKSIPLPSHSEKNEFERCDKNTNALQVRYTPKSGYRKKQTADMMTVSMANTRSSPNSSVQSCVISDGISFSGVQSGSQSSVISNPCHSNLGGRSGYANESMFGGGSTLAGPDLLQVSVIQPGSSRKSDSPSSRQTSPRQLSSAQASGGPQPKKQSFFARLAHSPMSFLHRDSKNASQSK